MKSLAWKISTLICLAITSQASFAAEEEKQNISRQTQASDITPSDVLQSIEIEMQDEESLRARLTAEQLRVVSYFKWVLEMQTWLTKNYISILDSGQVPLGLASKFDHFIFDAVNFFRFYSKLKYDVIYVCENNNFSKVKVTNDRYDHDLTILILSHAQRGLRRAKGLIMKEIHTRFFYPSDTSSYQDLTRRKFSPLFKFLDNVLKDATRLLEKEIPSIDNEVIRNMAQANFSEAV